MDKKVTLAQLKEVVQEAYDQVKTNTGGKTPTISPTWQMSTKISLESVSACSTGRPSMWEILTTASASNPYPKYIRPSLHCANMVPKKY